MNVHMSFSERLFRMLMEETDTGGLRNMRDDLEIELIRLRGHRDGVAAASWLIDGNTQDVDHVLRRLNRGIEEGDPLILDELPQPRLGGEFADDPTWEDVLRDELVRFDGSDGYDDLFQEYNDGFQNGVAAEIHRMAVSYSVSL